MVSSFLHCFRSVNSKMSEIVFPQNPLVGAGALFFGWYGRQVFLTYGPQMLADFCIQSTIQSIGNEVLGELIGTTCVAPAMVPSLVPIVATVAGGCAACLFTVIANLFCMLIGYLINRCRPVKSGDKVEIAP